MARLGEIVFFILFTYKLLFTIGQAKLGIQDWST